MDEKEFQIFEEVDLSDEDDDDEYGALMSSDAGSEKDEDELEDFDKLLASTAIQRQECPSAFVSERPAVVDDFVRNFLVNYGLNNTLEVFQNEWYDLHKSGKLLPEDGDIVRDLHIRNGQMIEEFTALRREHEHVQAVGKKAMEAWDKFKKERDFHKTNHIRVVEEREQLKEDLHKLKKHYEAYEPTLTELRHKYEVALKEKMLLRIEREKLQARLDGVEKEISLKKGVNNSKDSKGSSATPVVPQSHHNSMEKSRDSTWPQDDRPNPHRDEDLAPVGAAQMRVARSFPQAHDGGIARVKFHPKGVAICTVGDDHLWKMWSVPQGELIMSATGHKDWVSGIDIHPKGSIVATSSGDGNVKIWDVVQEGCTHTFTDHQQAVWNVVFHDEGDFLVSASMDHSCKVFDLNALRCRNVLRGHVDSVNYVTFSPYSNIVATASADRTTSLWDLRSGLCTQTFYGHGNSVNHCAFSLKGDLLTSSDADGNVKVWDPRSVVELVSIDTGVHPANAAIFDRSGKIVTIASGDSTVKFFDVAAKNFVISQAAHEEQVQDVCFDSNGKYMATCSSDGSWRLWN